MTLRRFTSTRFLFQETLCLFLISLACPHTSYAQTVPPTLEPARIDENRKNPATTKSVPPSSIKLSPEELPPESAAGVTFVLTKISIEGNSVLTFEQLNSLWKKKSGDVISVSEIFALANSITKLYAEKGYALCFCVVPKQEIVAGEVKLVVVEGYVSRQTPSNNSPTGFALEASNLQVKRIKDSRPLAAKTLERNLLLMDDLPGWSTTAVLNPDPAVVGGSVINIEFVEEPAAVDFSWSTFLPQGLGRNLAGVSFVSGSLLKNGTEVTLGYYLSPSSDAYRSISAGASTLVGYDGERLAFSMTQSDSKPQDAVLLPLKYLGYSRNLRLALSKPLIRSRSSTLVAEASFGAQDSDSRMSAGLLSEDHIRTLGLSLTYDHAGTDQSSNFIRLGLEQGLPWLGAKGNSRSNGSPVFTIATADMTRSAPLVRFSSSEFSYSVGAQAQVSLGDPLLSSNESAFGGRQFGRFFDSGSMNGEHAIFGSLELRYTFSAQLGFAQAVRTQLFVFGDAGLTQQKGKLQPQEARQRHAASSGLGVRLVMPYGISALLEVAQPVTLPSGYTGDKSRRINASLSARF